MQRYVYIHGCPDTAPMGAPHSIGCIRMRNAEVMQLFDLVTCGTEVVIVADRDRDEFIIRLICANKAHKLPATQAYCSSIHNTDALICQAWDQWGQLIASMRLRKDGVLDGIAMEADGKALSHCLQAIDAQVKAWKWHELRVMIPLSQMALFLPYGFTPIGDEFQWAATAYQSLRKYIANPI
jgi:hypothetical protein